MQSIRIVLVETPHAGNMGSVARTMRTMELTNLRLVSPLVKPDSQAIILAAGASDAIDNARVVDTLNEALTGYNLVVDTSARSCTLPWPMLGPRKCSSRSVAGMASTPVALVFSRERVSLTNEELQKCRYHVAIVASPEYSSLNLAMAVQAIVYEVRMAWLTTQEDGEQVEYEGTPHPLIGDLERFYNHPEQTLLATDLIRENYPGQVMSKLRRLLTHTRPENQELNILRGILASIEQQNKGDKAE